MMIDELENLESFAALGCLSWLYMNSPLHSNWSTCLMMQNLLPPIGLKQYALVFSEGNPAAFISWAYFSADAERRYIEDPSKIDVNDWNSGDRIWFIDLISPFDKRNTFNLFAKIAPIFDGKYGRSLYVDGVGEAAQIRTYPFKNMPKNWKAEADKAMFEQIAIMSDAATRDGRQPKIYRDMVTPPETHGVLK